MLDLSNSAEIVSHICIIWCVVMCVWDTGGSSSQTTGCMVTYSALIIHHLDLSWVAQFDLSSHGDVELSARLEVQPHKVALWPKHFGNYTRTFTTDRKNISNCSLYEKQQCKVTESQDLNPPAAQWPWFSLGLIPGHQKSPLEGAAGRSKKRQSAAGTAFMRVEYNNWGTAPGKFYMMWGLKVIHLCTNILFLYYHPKLNKITKKGEILLMRDLMQHNLAAPS